MTHGQKNIKLLFFNCHHCSTNASRRYVTRTLPVTSFLRLFNLRGLINSNGAFLGAFESGAWLHSFYEATWIRIN